MPSPEPPRVLVVDDYANATEVWALYLRSLGFAVDTATDGPGAIAQALAGRPDVIVMDLQLPGCSGVDVAKALRADPAARDIPLIAATGSTDRHVLDTARRYFQAIVAKPCNPADLVAQIRRLLPATSE